MKGTKRLAIMATTLALAAALSGCGSRGTIFGSEEFSRIKRVFQDEMPSSATVMKLYGSENGVQKCAIAYANGDVSAATLYTNGAPFYAFYDRHDARLDSPVGTIDTDRLRITIQQCIDQAKVAEYHHQPSVTPDD